MQTSEPHSPRHEPPRENGTGRMEAFSDGVIAVIITVMVLELHVPRGNSVRDLLELWPTMLSYFASYMFVAVYWVNHHRLVRAVARVDYRVLWTNILWLFTLSFIPFFTAYVGQKGVSPLPVKLYTASMFACAASFFLLRMAVNTVRCQDGIRPDVMPGATAKHVFGVTSYAVAFAVATRWPLVSMWIIIGVATFYIIPEAGLRNDESALG